MCATVDKGSVHTVRLVLKKMAAPSCVTEGRDATQWFMLKVVIEANRKRSTAINEASYNQRFLTASCFPYLF